MDEATMDSYLEKIDDNIKRAEAMATELRHLKVVMMLNELLGGPMPVDQPIEGYLAHADTEARLHWPMSPAAANRMRRDIDSGSSKYCVRVLSGDKEATVSLSQGIRAELLNTLIRQMGGIC